MITPKIPVSKTNLVAVDKGQQNWISHVIFVFLLFVGMFMYANEVETKEN